MSKPILTPLEAYKLVRQGLVKTALDGYVTNNFQWREVFTECTMGEVAGCHSQFYQNALIQAELMEKIRAYFGNKPITVTSWYRDKAHNRRVNGATKSRHLVGLATDFEIKGFEGVSGNAKVQKMLDKLPWMANRGLEFTHGEWTHVDSGGYSRFHA
jgi:hypothetical protein